VQKAIMEEIDLIKNSVNGDKECFNILVEPYINQAYKTSFLILNDRGLAEDAVQESLYQSYISLHRFDGSKAQFKTWFNKIVVNCTLKMKRKIFFFIEFKPEQSTMVDISPEDHYTSNEENEILYDAIHNLSIKLRTVIVLFYFQSLSIEEISLTLDISDGTVKSRLHKARGKLGQILKDDIHFGGDKYER
jgi:RNA polymerase sigma factor (sigma-70 family)